jgi:hypothetical protein
MASIGAKSLNTDVNLLEVFGRRVTDLRTAPTGQGGPCAHA